MPDIKEYLIELFRGLPDWVKLLAFVILFMLAVVQTAWKWLEYWKVRRLEEELDRTKSERDELTSRFQSLNKVDSVVWMKPDSLEQNKPTPKTERPVRFVAICNFKGGVGKTMLTLNLGITLALKGKRVLIVDLDWQSTLSKLAMPEEQRQQYQKNGWTTDALFRSGITSTDAKTWMFPLKYAPNCKIMLARQELDLVEFEAQSRFFVDPRQHEVRFAIQRILHAREISQEFDYVLFDCPPRLTTGCINALTCADFVLLPTSLGQGDIEAVPHTLEWIRLLRSVVTAEVMGVVITRARLRRGKPIARDKAQASRLKEISRKHKAEIFGGIIPDSQKIHQTVEDEHAVAALDPDIRAIFDVVAREMERKAST